MAIRAYGRLAISHALKRLFGDLCYPVRCSRPAVTLADRPCDGRTMQGSSISAVRIERTAHPVRQVAFLQIKEDLWSGAGSNRRPSAFQVNRAKRCADLRKRTSLTSGTALGGRCTTHASRAPEQYAGSERDDWRSPQYSSTTTVRLISRNRSDNAVTTGLSNVLCLFSSRTAMPNAPPGSRPRSDWADDAGA
jgi:hypothetical protein